jgi:hypothetical protein
MKDITKNYHVKHELGDTTLTINMTFLTFSYLLSLIFATGFAVINVIEKVYEITGG